MHRPCQTGRTWSRYLAWILWRASHILQGLSGSGKTSWLTMMLWVSILHLASSWISRSVSYRDRNSAMHTQMKVVCSCSRAKTDGAGGSPFLCSQPLPHCGALTHRVLELLADRPDDGQCLLQLGCQLVGVHVTEAQHVTHLWGAWGRFTLHRGPCNQRLDSYDPLPNLPLTTGVAPGQIPRPGQAQLCHFGGCCDHRLDLLDFPCDLPGAHKLAPVMCAEHCQAWGRHHLHPRVERGCASGPSRDNPHAHSCSLV